MPMLYLHQNACLTKSFKIMHNLCICLIWYLQDSKLLTLCFFNTLCFKKVKIVFKLFLGVDLGGNSFSSSFQDKPFFCNQFETPQVRPSVYRDPGTIESPFVHWFPWSRHIYIYQTWVYGLRCLVFRLVICMCS